MALSDKRKMIFPFSTKLSAPKKIQREKPNPEAIKKVLENLEKVKVKKDDVEKSVDSLMDFTAEEQALLGNNFVRPNHVPTPAGASPKDSSGLITFAIGMERKRVSQTVKRPEPKISMTPPELKILPPPIEQSWKNGDVEMVEKELRPSYAVPQKKEKVKTEKVRKNSEKPERDAKDKLEKKHKQSSSVDHKHSKHRHKDDSRDKSEVIAKAKPSKHKHRHLPKPPLINFQDLLKMAEEKQHEPLKIEVAVKKKPDGRPKTQEEIDRENRKKTAEYQNWLKYGTPRPAGINGSLGETFQYGSESSPEHNSASEETNFFTPKPASEKSTALVSSLTKRRIPKIKKRIDQEEAIMNSLFSDTVHISRTGPKTEPYLTGSRQEKKSSSSSGDFPKEKEMSSSSGLKVQDVSERSNLKAHDVSEKSFKRKINDCIVKENIREKVVFGDSYEPPSKKTMLENREKLEKGDVNRTHEKDKPIINVSSNSQSKDYVSKRLSNGQSLKRPAIDDGKKLEKTVVNRTLEKGKPMEKQHSLNTKEPSVKQSMLEDRGKPDKDSVIKSLDKNKSGVNSSAERQNSSKINYDLNKEKSFKSSRQVENVSLSPHKPGIRPVSVRPSSGFNATADSNERSKSRSNETTDTWNAGRSNDTNREKTHQHNDQTKHLLSNQHKSGLPLGNVRPSSGTKSTVDNQERNKVKTDENAGVNSGSSKQIKPVPASPKPSSSTQPVLRLSGSSGSLNRSPLTSTPPKANQPGNREGPSKLRLDFPPRQERQHVIDCTPHSPIGDKKTAPSLAASNPFDRIMGQMKKSAPKPVAKKSRVIESSEEDSEMDDFIAADDDEELDDPSSIDVSACIRDVFGYDRRKFRYERDDDLADMEVNYSTQMKEEARSTRLGLLEDLEDMKKEEEELRQKQLAKKKKFKNK